MLVAGIFHLRVVLESAAGQPFFIIRSERLPNPPDVTLDATAELRKLDIALELVGRLGEGDTSSAEFDEVTKMLEETTGHVKQIRQERQALEQELASFEEKRRKLAQKEKNSIQKMRQLKERQIELVIGPGSPPSDNRIPTQHLWNELRHARDVSCDEWRKLDGDTLLRWAMKNNCIEVVRLLLENPFTGVNTINRSECEILMQAAEERHRAVVQLLLDRGVAIEAEDRKGWTALLLAAHQGHATVVRLLLDRGAAIEVRDENGRTALLWAAYQGHEAVVQLLLDRGAAIEAKDQYGVTALSRAAWAAHQGHVAVVQLLLNRGAVIEAKNQHGLTPLSASRLSRA